MNKHIFFLFLFCVMIACQQPSSSQTADNVPALQAELKVGAAQFETYRAELKNKRVALVVNHTSVVNKTHLVDTLLQQGVHIKTIFAPEHGFRGEADAGAHIDNSEDHKTGLPVLSLHGKNKKPTTEQMADIDVILFDIQDVGCRFYTYVSTMHYVMEAAAEQGKKVIVLDRPNPNGFYVDGPVLDPDYQSFIGMHQVPVVHGMTLGELAQMINGEGWLADGQKCNLQVVPVVNWLRQDEYLLPISPSPNLRSQEAIYNYPSLCFFEGTILSIGRGTDNPFTVIGHPELTEQPYSFTPKPSPGAQNPKLNGKLCHGVQLLSPDLSKIKEKGIDLDFMIYASDQLGAENFFLKNNFIDKLAGTDRLRHLIISGSSSSEIKEEWQSGIDKFMVDRKPYLLYKD